LIVVTSSNLIGGQVRLEVTKSNHTIRFIVAHALRTIEAFVDISHGIICSISFKMPEKLYNIETKFTSIGDDYDGYVMVKENNKEHKLNISFNPSLLSVDAKLSSPMLKYDIISNVKLDLEDRNAMLQSLVEIGDIVHSLKSGYSYASKSVNFILEIQTPMFNLQKLNLRSDIQIADRIRADAILELFGEKHSFEFQTNMEPNQRVTLIISSPKLPGQLFKVEGLVAGDYPKNIDVIGSLQFNNQSFSSKLNLDLYSLRNIYSSLEVKTPFAGYRKMNFVLGFQQNDNIKINLTADSPINLKIEIQSGKIEEYYKTLVHIETPVVGYEKIIMSAEIPMNKTATKVVIELPSSTYGFDFKFADEKYAKSAALHLINNGAHYGGGLKLRYKAPYELDVEVVDNRFHVMMDSSVFNMIYDYYFF